MMIAEYVTQKDGDWIKVELDKCQTRGQVKLCYALEEDKIQCLEKGEGCPIVGTSCRTDIKELPSGVLANTIQRKVKGVKRGETALKVIPESGYYSYNVYKSLILDERVLFSLEHTQTEVMVSLPTTPAHLIYVEEEIADNPDLDRMRAMVKEHHDMIGEKLAPSMGSLTEICAWVGTGLWLIWGGYKLWAQMKWEQMSTAGRLMKSRIWRTLEEAEVEQPHQLQQQEMLQQQETLRAMVKEHHDMIGEKLAPSMGSLTEICAWVGTGLWLIWGGYKLWAQMKWEQMSTAGRLMKSRIWRTLEEAEVEQPHQLQQQEMLQQQETLLQQEVEALKKNQLASNYKQLNELKFY